MANLDSILRDPTLMWDQRCAAAFTLCGRDIQDDVNRPTKEKIEKMDHKIITLYQSCGLSITEYLSVNAELQKLYENPPASIEDRAEYLGKIQGLLLRLPEAIYAAQIRLASLAKQLTPEKRQKYYEAMTDNWVGVNFTKPLGRKIRDAQKGLYNAANECTALLSDRKKQCSLDVPKELYIGMVTDDLKEWKDLLDKIYHPETVNRQEYFAQLRAGKDFIDSALPKILNQADAKNESIHESWREVQDFLDRDFSRAKFYTDSKDENLAELSELLQSNPQAYKEKSLLYGHKLIDQKAHQEAVDHAIKWMESPPQGASWEDASQMINLFMQANGKDAAASKFLHALNRWTKDRPNRHSSDIPKELYMRMMIHDLKEWQNLLDKVYQPETTDADRQECFNQLQVRKGYFDPTLSEILKQADAQGESIHEGWSQARDVLDRDFSLAKFYIDTKDANLIELGELFQSNPQEYREKSLLYEQKLINQGAHQEAVDHAIQWVESPPQDTSWEEASQMINLFMRANEKSGDAAKFLHSLNRWAKDQLHLQSPDIPEEFYIRLVTCALKEWEELLDKIYQPETTDADRQECFTQLRARRDRIYPALSEILKQADAKNEPIHEGWRKARSALERDFSRARFYADSQDENLAELGELFQINPQEYREKSLLYEQKLLDRGAHQEAADYAIQWIESLSQDASWEDVAQMINLFMQANEKSTDTAKFLHALNCWTKDQPDLHVDPETYFPLGKGAEYIAIAKGMLYSNTDWELSFEAAEYYQVWQTAKPDDPIPKVLLVRFHMANAEWDKSKQIIAKLPEEYSIPLSKSMAIHMFNVYSLPLDAAEMAILRSAIPFARRKVLRGSMGDRALDILSSTVQGIFHQVLRRCWLPYCIKDLSPLSEEPLSSIDKASLGIFAAQTMSPFILPPIFSFLTPNLETRRTYLQPVIEFSGPILGITNSGMLAYEAYRAKASLAKPATIFASTTVSLLGRSVLRSNKDLSPTKRGMIMTSLKILDLARDLQAIYASQPAITSIASYVAIRYRVQPLCSKIENYLSKVPAARSSKVIVAASAAGMVAYGFFFDFPRARTGAVLEEAIRLCHEQKYLEAIDLLSTAKEWLSIWSDRSVIQQYADCIPFFERSSKIGNNTDDREWLGNILPDVDNTIETLEKSEYYSNAKEDLQYHEVIAYLNTEQAEPAKIILDSIDVSSAVHGHVVLFVIEKAKGIARKDPSEVDDYLNWVKSIFWISAYSEIVIKYQEYFAFQKQYPVLPVDQIDEKGRIISSLIKLIQPRKGLRQLEENLLFEALLLYVNTDDSAKAEDLLNQTGTAAHEQLALILIEQAIEWSAQNEFGSALVCLNRGIVLNEFTPQPLLIAFKTYIESQQAHPHLTKDSPHEINQRISALDAISQNAGNIDIFPFVRKEKLFFYIQVENFQEAAEWVTEHSIETDVQDSVILEIIQNAQDLPKPDALKYLIKAYDAFDKFKHRGILKNIQDCLPHDPEKLASAQAGIEWGEAADALIQKTESIKSLASLHVLMKSIRALLHIHQQEYAAAFAITAGIELPKTFQTKAIAIIINQAQKLSFQEASLHLEDAYTTLLNFEDREILRLYKNCLLSNDFGENSPEEDARWAAAADVFIAAVKPLPELSSSYLMMNASKCMFHISRKEYIVATAILRESILKSEFQSNILKYILYEIHELSQKNQDLEASTYLERAYDELKEFSYRDILSKFRDHLAGKKDCLTSESVDKWDKESEALIEDLRPIPQMSDFILKIRFRQFEVFLTHNKFLRIKHVLEQDEISPELRKKLQEQLIGYFVNHALKLKEFEWTTRLLGISEYDLAKKYRAFRASLSQHISEPTSLSNIQKSIEHIEILSTLLEETLKLPLPNWILSNQANLHFSAGQIYLQRSDFASSLKALSQAEKLFETQNLPETQEILAYTRHLKEQALALT